MLKRLKVTYLLGVVLLLSSCVPSTPVQSVPDSTVASDETSVEVAATTEAKVKGPYDILTQEVLDLGFEYTLNTTGHTVISKASRDKEFRTTYMIISKSGKVIVSDPYNVIPGIKADIITSSHQDYDHRDGKFNAYNPTSKIVNWKVDTFTENDIKVTGIASTHYDYKINIDNPSNVIYVYEVDGIRIAAMGDICQQEFTEDQLKALGHIDVVFIIMEDASTFGYSAENTMNMLKQLNPTIAMPTHQSSSVLDQVATLFDERIEAEYSYEITEERLSDGKTKLVILADVLK